MKVRQLRKRKPVPLLASLSRTIRQRMIELTRGKGLRDDTAGRAALGGVVDRVVEEYLGRHGPPPGCRKVLFA